jgi:uncharacterized phage protein (TIGR01671 family)
MNREILFRAKAINRDTDREYRTNYKNGDWVYGLITKPYNEEYDFPAEMRNTDGVTGIEVDYKTIGQFTGLIDSEGTKIFEGDIIQDGYCDYNKYVVEYSTERGGFLPFTHGDGCGCCEINTLHDSTCHTVIGNIYDNPELIGGEQNDN